MADPTSCCEFDRQQLQIDLTTSISGDPASVAPLVRHVMTLVERTGCGQQHEAAIELALSEALANAVVHGAQRDPSKQIEVVVACQPDRGILLVVRDPGTGFSADSLPDTISADQLFSEHGRGIYLIRQVMDEVRFARGGTEIRMRKYPL